MSMINDYVTGTPNFYDDPNCTVNPQAGFEDFPDGGAYASDQHSARALCDEKNGEQFNEAFLWNGDDPNVWACLPDELPCSLRVTPEPPRPRSRKSPGPTPTRRPVQWRKRLRLRLQLRLRLREGQATNDSIDDAIDLENCAVTTEVDLRLRAAPWGKILAAVPRNTEVPTKARTKSWYNVTYEKTVGLVSRLARHA